MYWTEEEVEEYARYPSEGGSHELGSPVYIIPQIDLESEEAMAEHDSYLEQNGFDYAPIRPYSSREYYEYESGEVRSTSEEQYVGRNDIMLHCLNILTEYPFALIVHPDRKSWKIVTPADLNNRTAKEYMFMYYSEMAKAVSELVKNQYSQNEIEEAYDEARPDGGALSRWEDAVDENVNLHPVEFMSIADLKEIVRNDDELLGRLELPSKTQAKKRFDKVEKYRNKVMHGNRSVIATEEDVTNLVESLELASEITIAAGGDEPGLDIPP